MVVYNLHSKKIVFENPFASFLFFTGRKGHLHEAIVYKAAKYLFKGDFNFKEWQNALKEIKKGDFIPFQSGSDRKPITGNSLETTFGKWIYCVVRVFKPEIMIETGVAHGASSWIILNAMNKNKKGKLYSIDLANNDSNSNYNFFNQIETGWLVPDALRERWQLHLGDAKNLLPALLNELKKIDVFFHDSAHTYEHMKFEFESVFPFMNKEGIILSDDVKLNFAFSEFVSKNHLRAIQFNKGGCAKP